MGGESVTHKNLQSYIPDQRQSPPLSVATTVKGCTHRAMEAC